MSASAYTILTVEEALDKYVAAMEAKGIDPGGFKAATLAAAADVDTSAMSALLQEYRYGQADDEGAQRYVVACTGYGRAARWRILAKPGTDPRDIQNARREHAVHVANDAVERFLRDRDLEVEPGIRASSKRTDQEIAAAVDHAAAMLTQTAELVKQLLANRAP